MKKRDKTKKCRIKHTPPSTSKAHSINCLFCFHCPICEYKDKYEERARELFPMDVRCRFFKEYNDYPKGDWV